MPHDPVDLSLVRTIPLQVRPNKVSQAKFARPAVKGQSAGAFLDGLPGVEAGANESFGRYFDEQGTYRSVF